MTPGIFRHFVNGLKVYHVALETCWTFSHALDLVGSTFREHPGLLPLACPHSPTQVSASITSLLHHRDTLLPGLPASALMSMLSTAATVILLNKAHHTTSQKPSAAPRL